MQAIKRNSDILLILLVGFSLRFSIAINHSYTNDELSAINRLRYNSFSDLIEYGVKAGDMHPAGVQVFMKAWTTLFGTSEIALRFPFVIFGTLSIWIIFLLGKNGFNRKTGIYSAALLSFLYFPVMQSELARPYSPGLLIALLTALLFYNVLFKEEKKYRNAILLGGCFAAGMYTHYFLFLFVAWMGVTGLFFIKSSNIKAYLLAGLIAIVLYLPHLSVTVYHLNVGGLQWLGPPKADWLLQFIFYVFNSSFFITILIFVLLLFSFFEKFSNEKIHFQSRYFFISLIWFFGIYLIGHLLSLVSTPLLKEPVMLFALPFLLLPIGYILSHLKKEKIVGTVLMGIILCSTIFENSLYGIKNQGYKLTAKAITDWKLKYSEENIYTVYNLSNPNYMNFYANQWGDTIHFDWDVIEFSDDIPIRKSLLSRKEKYCIVGYSERLTLPQVFETVREFYPIIVDYYSFNNSAVFLMSNNRNEKPIYTIVENEISRLFDEKNSTKWFTDSLAIKTDLTTKNKIYELNKNRIYGPDFIFNLNSINKIENTYFKIEVKADLPEDAQLTAAVSVKRNGDFLHYRGENFWMGHDLEEMLITTKNKTTGIGTAYFCFELPDFIKNSDEIKFSLWNRNGKQINIHEFKIVVVENIWN